MEQGIEIWKDVPNGLIMESSRHPDRILQASNLGRVKRLAYKGYGGKLFPDFFYAIGNCGRGYTKIGPSKTSLHRIIATTFMPNPLNLPEVNHINGNKRDNRVENLEWCTISHNRKHGYTLGLNIGARGSGKAVNMYNFHGEFIKKFNTVPEACIEMNISRHMIYACVNGKRKTAAGYRWAYIGQPLQYKRHPLERQRTYHKVFKKMN